MRILLFTTALYCSLINSGAGKFDGINAKQGRFIKSEWLCYLFYFLLTSSCFPTFSLFYCLSVAVSELLTCSHWAPVSESQPGMCHTCPPSRRLHTHTFPLHHTAGSLNLRTTADGFAERKEKKREEDVKGAQRVGGQKEKHVWEWKGALREVNWWNTWDGSINH